MRVIKIYTKLSSSSAISPHFRSFRTTLIGHFHHHRKFLGQHCRIWATQELLLNCGSPGSLLAEGLKWPARLGEGPGLSLHDLVVFFLVGAEVILFISDLEQ